MKVKPVSARMRFVHAVCLAFCVFCPASVSFALDTNAYRVYIVSDTLKEKFTDLQSGFRETLDRQLSVIGKKAVYTVFDTKTDPATVPGIIAAIKAGGPDLICVINSSSVFADTNITLKLTDPKYKFVSENCIPVQSGAAKTWDKPGGNITGVGVFVNFTSLIKLAKMIRPESDKLCFYTWDAVKPVNEYFEAEIARACRETGTELVEFKRLASAEDEFEYLKSLDGKGPEYFTVPGISAYVHRDGTPADMAVEGAAFMRENLKHLGTYTYDEAAVKVYHPAGTCVVWYDLGAQLAEKGMKILQGANPGDLPWEYPRKHTIILNLAAAKLVGMNIPQTVLSAAHRIYTDFEGNFVGKKN